MARKIKAKLIMELREQGVSRRSIARTRRMSMDSVCDVFDIADEHGITWAQVEGMSGGVMCDQDEAWSDARYFSAARMAELYDAPDGASAEDEFTQERFSEWQTVARRAIEASLELADELEAA